MVLGSLFTPFWLYFGYSGRRKGAKTVLAETVLAEPGDYSKDAVKKAGEYKAFVKANFDDEDKLGEFLADLEAATEDE